MPGERGSARTGSRAPARLGRRGIAAIAALACAAAGAGCGTEGPSPGWPEGVFSAEPGERELGYRDTARPWVIGHRGTGTGPLEDTLPAILGAITAEGAVGAEFDVMLTADLEVVVMHDPRLDRTTDCTGCVSELTLEEVQRCVAVGSPFGEPVHPPSLAEVLRALEALPVEPLAMIDVKPHPEEMDCPAVAEDAVALLGTRIGEEVEKAGVARFSAVQGPTELLDAARAVSPGLVTLRWGDLGEAIAEAGRHGFSGVAVGVQQLTSSSVAEARARGLLVDTFVVNAPVDIAAAVAHDVDVIETDDVPRVLASF